MTNQTGPFDIQQRKLRKKYYNIQIKQLEYKVSFPENSFIGDAS